MRKAQTGHVTDEGYAGLSKKMQPEGWGCGKTEGTWGATNSTETA